MHTFQAILLSLLVLLSPACGDDHPADPGDGSRDKPAGPPVTQSEAILTADAYARLHWTMSPQNQTGVSCGRGFFSTYPAGPRIGMGYKWGGWTGIEEFIEKIGEGYGTGTGGGFDTYDDYPIECVVGTSCTGLVSRAWHLYEKYTLCYDDPGIPRKLCEISREITDVDFGSHDRGSLEKGDAFINEFHTILYVYEARDGGVYVIDSTIEGVRFRRITWGFLADNGYTAIRYENIVSEENPFGTVENPIVVAAEDLPFTYAGNTRDVVSMAIDRYSCDPADGQPGPELVFELRMTAPGTATFLVSDVKNEGINNDIHVLESLEIIEEVRLAPACIGRGDDTLTLDLDPGVYFVVVDSSSDMPGDFTLFVDVK